jgi:hypothetical protein
MVDEELRARIINRAKVKLGKMKELSILEAVTLLEYIEELESRPTPLAVDVAYECPKCGATLEKDGWCAQHGLPAQPRQ